MTLAMPKAISRFWVISDGRTVTPRLQQRAPPPGGARGRNRLSGLLLDGISGECNYADQGHDAGGRAGQQAGRVLASLDYRPLGRVIALRDETFFHGWPILFLVEPRSGVILLGHVGKDRSAETWGTALLVAQDTGVELAGLVEDMGRTFPQSLKALSLIHISEPTRPY